jgi:hypothetical protein
VVKLHLGKLLSRNSPVLLAHAAVQLAACLARHPSVAPVPPPFRPRADPIRSTTRGRWLRCCRGPSWATELMAVYGEDSVKFGNEKEGSSSSSPL